MLSALLCVLLVLVYYLRRFYSDLKKYPPGPTPLPLIGNLHQLNYKKPWATIAEWSKVYGAVFTVHLPTPNVVITGPEEIRQALVKNADALAGRPHTALMRLLSGHDGVIFADGDRWTQRRRFALRTLRDLGVGRKSVEVKIVKQAELVADAFRPYALSHRPMDPTEPVESAVGNVIAEVLFGRTLSENTMHRLKVHIDRHNQMCFDWPTRLWETLPAIINVPLFGNFHYKPLTENRDRVHQLIGEEIVTTLRHSEQKKDRSGEEPDNFIECYLKQMEVERSQEDANNMFTDRDLLCTTTELAMAGMETSVTTLKWALLFLSQHTRAQDRCRDELLRATVEQGRELGMGLKKHTPYFAATLHEVQRLGNIVPINLQHRVTKPITIGDNVTLPTGATVVPQIANVFADAAYFPNPDKFEPERFMGADYENDCDSADSVADNTEGSVALTQNNAQNVTPFSLGKRSCAGEALARAELYLILAKLLLEFEFAVHTEPASMDGVMWTTRQTFPYKLTLKALK